MQVDLSGVDVEFYAPFAHVPGRYEWCRLRTATHGIFDAFIVLGEGTHAPATVYVHDDAGEAFMAERFPECATVRVPPEALVVDAAPDGRGVHGFLVAEAGPVRSAAMHLLAAADRPRAEPYGDGRPVWGSRYTCWGVDLVLDGRADGRVEHEDGTVERLRGTPCIVTVGSIGLLQRR